MINRIGGAAALFLGAALVAAPTSAGTVTTTYMGTVRSGASTEFGTPNQYTDFTGAAYTATFVTRPTSLYAYQSGPFGGYPTTTGIGGGQLFSGNSPPPAQDPRTRLSAVSATMTINGFTWASPEYLVGAETRLYEAPGQDVLMNATYVGVYAIFDRGFWFTRPAGLSFRVTYTDPSRLSSAFFTRGGTYTPIADRFTPGYQAYFQTITPFVRVGPSPSYAWSGNYATDLALNLTSFSVSVPEPASWAMMMLGFGAIGTALRRRPARAGFQLDPR